MVLSKVGHFMLGWGIMFGLGQIVIALGYIIVVLVKSFLLWEPVAFIQVNMLGLRILELVFVCVGIWFATSKDWWEVYEGE